MTSSRHDPCRIPADGFDPGPSRTARRGTWPAVPAVALVLVTAPVVAQAATGDPVWVRSITGSQDNGFHIVWSDSTHTYTPTRSEATAECGEYDTRVERVACRASTRTSYRWMGITKRSLAHAR